MFDPQKQIDRAQKAYRKSLQGFINELYKEIPSIDEDNYKEVASIIKGLGKNKKFVEYSELLATKIVDVINCESQQQWDKATRELKVSQEISKALKEEYPLIKERHELLISQNIQVIKDIPDNIADMFTQHTKDAILSGRRTDSIVKELRTYLPEVAKSRIELHARTQSSIAYSAFTQVRAEAVGANWYQWKTSKDSRVRNSHEHMENVLVRFDDPPSPELLIGLKSQGKYNAGGTWNCRCYHVPVILISQLTFPAKVHIKGQLIKMSKLQFKKVA